VQRGDVIKQLINGQTCARCRTVERLTRELRKETSQCSFSAARCPLRGLQGRPRVTFDPDLLADSF